MVSNQSVYEYMNLKKMNAVETTCFYAVMIFPHKKYFTYSFAEAVQTRINIDITVFIISLFLAGKGGLFIPNTFTSF